MNPHITSRKLNHYRHEEIVQPTPAQQDADRTDYIWFETLYCLNSRQTTCLNPDHRTRHIRNATIGLDGDELWNVICF